MFVICFVYQLCHVVRKNPRKLKKPLSNREVNINPPKPSLGKKELDEYFAYEPSSEENSSACASLDDIAGICRVL